MNRRILSANLYLFSVNYDSLRLADKSYFYFMDDKITNIINKLLPPELDKTKKLIEELLEIKPNERSTNLEYLEINESMFNDIIILNINIRSNDVYSTSLPFDIEEYKEWYSNRNSE